MLLGRPRWICGAGLLIGVAACSEDPRPSTGSGGASSGASSLAGTSSGATSMGGSDSATSGAGGDAGAPMNEAGAAGADDPICSSCPNVTGCVDLDSDPQHCGKCGRACGVGAECVAGKCGCPEGTLDCSDATLLECRPVLDDPANCGACDRKCMTGSQCYDGACSVEVRSVRLFGDEAAAPGSALLARADDGGYFVGLGTTGPHRALPAGAQPLWEGAAVGKLDADFEVEWLVPTSARIVAVASAGSDFWVVVSTNQSAVTFGSSSYEPAFGRSGLFLAFKLKGDDGTLLEEHRFDTYDSTSVAQLVTDGDGAWLVIGTLSGAIDYQGISSTPPSGSYSSVLYRLGSASPRWLPGIVQSFHADDDERLLLGVSVGFLGNISFGGDTFSTGKLDQAATARYSKLLKHDISFVLPPEFGPAQAVLPMGDDLVFVGHDDAFLKTYDASGVIKSAEGPDGARFSIVASELRAGKLHFLGRGWGTTHTFAGIELPGSEAFFMTFDVATGELQTVIFPGESEISSFVLDESGSTLSLGLSLDGALWLDGETYNTNGTNGVAFVDFELNAP